MKLPAFRKNFKTEIEPYLGGLFYRIREEM
jgi:hypothetical protein